VTSPPRIATWLITRTVIDEGIVGDLLEHWQRGRSRMWYWRQVLSAIIIQTHREVHAHKAITVRAILTGWMVLLVLFRLCGDLVANGLAHQATGWTREIGYSQWIWPPFWLTAWLVSYTGFAISGRIVARTHSASALLAYAASTFVVLAASVVFFGTRGPTPVPHTLFYVVSVALPYQWRTGLIVAPAVVVVAGLIPQRRRFHPSCGHDRSRRNWRT